MQYTSDNMTTIWLNIYNQVYSSIVDSDHVKWNKANKKAIELANKAVNKFTK